MMEDIRCKGKIEGKRCERSVKSGELQSMSYKLKTERKKLKVTTPKKKTVHILYEQPSSSNVFFVGLVSN